MKHKLLRWSTTLVALAALAGCGGGSDSGAVVDPAPATSVAAALSIASALAANDTSTNSSASFTVLQDAGVPAVTINSPPVVNFAVFSDGAVKTGLTASNVRFAIAKLVPGTNGNPDEWVSYINTDATATKGPGLTAGAGGTPVKVVQATVETGTSGTLSYNPDGYYTYTFKTDIKTVEAARGLKYKYEPTLTHRVAIQLSYKNVKGEDVLSNPYFDFTVVDGKSFAVTDLSKTRKMTDVADCNGCHTKLALHGGGRLDTQYCVMCHNPGTTDPESGNNLNMATMVHSIHAGKLLKRAGIDYKIWGYRGTEYDYAEVGFPQDLRNCTKCHTGANPKTPQGDNWKTQASKEACLTCHANNAGSDWDISHKNYAGTFVGTGAAAKALTNQQCKNCHAVGSNISPENVHWNQNEENSAKYKMNIESVTLTTAPSLTVDGKVTVQYHLSDPTNGDKPWKLESDATKFGSLSLYVGYQNIVNQNTAVTEPSAYNNGGSSAQVRANSGTNNGSNHYTAVITIPKNTATAVAQGTARVVTIGQVKEPLLKVKTNIVPRPVDDSVTPVPTVNVTVQNTFKEFALTGVLNPRRIIVSNDKCNVCHGSLGATSGANTLDNAFHSGARNTVEACVICHDANRASSTVMTDSSAFNESYQFKRMIHGIHGNSKRTYPFTYGNPVQGSFSKDGTLTASGSFLADYKIRNFAPVVIRAGTSVAAGSTFSTIADLINTSATKLGYKGNPVVIENFAAEVVWPEGARINCNACHEENSYKQDLGTLGAVIVKPTTVVTNTANPAITSTSDPRNWMIISPKAASCTACHDSSGAMGHVQTFGGASFAGKTQAEIAGLPRETCDDCHASGSGGKTSKGKFLAVDLAHGQK